MKKNPGERTAVGHSSWGSAVPRQAPARLPACRAPTVPHVAPRPSAPPTQGQGMWLDSLADSFSPKGRPVQFGPRTLGPQPRALLEETARSYDAPTCRCPRLARRLCGVPRGLMTIAFPAP